MDSVMTPDDKIRAAERAVVESAMKEWRKGNFEPLRDLTLYYACGDLFKARRPPTAQDVVDLVKASLYPKANIGDHAKLNGIARTIDTIEREIEERGDG
jgi:hypothetical protein